MPRPAAHARRVVALLSLSAAFLAPQTRTRHHRLHAKKPPPKKRDGRRLKIATNRKARFSYEIIKTMEAGIALQGTEVKSCRDGNANIRGRLREDRERRVHADQRRHCETQNDGRLLPARRPPPPTITFHKARSASSRGTWSTLVLRSYRFSLYFNDKNLLKVDLALCRGKSQRDKRKDIKGAEDKRMLARASKGVYYWRGPNNGEGGFEQG